MASKPAEVSKSSEAVAESPATDPKPELSKGTESVNEFSVDWEVVTKNDFKGRPNIKELRVVISHPKSQKVERATLALNIS